MLFVCARTLSSHPANMCCCCLPSSNSSIVTMALFLLFPPPFLVQKMTLLPLCDQIFTSALSLSSRLRYYQKSAFPAQPVYRELPFRRDRAVPSQEEAAHPEPADPAQPQRAIRGCERPGHQDPAQEMQLPQEQRVSTCAKKPTNQHR